MEETRLKVFVIDGVPLVRAGIASLVRGVPGWRVEGEFDTAADALIGGQGRVPDVIVLDRALSDQVGVSTIAELRRAYGNARILMFAGYPNERHVLEAFAAGAHGYALRGEHPKN